MRLDEISITMRDDGLFELSHDVRYAIADGFEVTVPQGFRTDFASLPPLTRRYFKLRGILDRVNSAGLLHDWLYSTHYFSRAVSDALMYQEVRTDKVPRFEAKLVLFALILLGWRAYKTAPHRRKLNNPDIEAVMGKAPKYEGV